MDEFREKLIGLLHYPGISWKTVLQCMKMDSNYPSSTNTLKTSVLPSLTTAQTEIITKQIHQYEKNDVHVITILDENYPSLLKEIYQPPWAIFVKGNLSLLEKEPKLAVVGSRQATQYGKNAIRLMFPQLVEKGIVIVSGLAAGIDTLAHVHAIKNGGNTIAVIAGGFNHIYPKENIELAGEMMKTQLVISEYPPDTKPLRWHFPARNRIISGLSNGIFIIEAKRKSGSLITANYAVHEGREVFSLPGSIFNPYSLGTNDLIQQGAKLVMRSEDILEELHLNN